MKAAANNHLILFFIKCASIEKDVFNNRNKYLVTVNEKIANLPFSNSCLIPNISY